MPEKRIAPLTLPTTTPNLHDSQLLDRFIAWSEAKVQVAVDGKISVQAAAKRLGTLMYAKEIQKKRLKLETEIDPLTKLPNYKGAQNILDRLISSKKSFGVIIADIDRFKALNYTYGHDLMNDLLVQTGIVFNAVLYHGREKEEDDIVTRLDKEKQPQDVATRKHGEHGDEFLIFLPSCTNEASLQIVCQKLLNAFNESPFFVDDGKTIIEVPLTISIGARGYRNGEDRTSFLNEISLLGTRRAKDEGRNRCIVLPKKPRVRTSRNKPKSTI